jgi:iron complex outermembrane receptor protein
VRPNSTEYFAVTRIVSSRKATLFACAAIAALSVGAAARADSAATDDPAETIVITSTKFNTDAAPAKASLATTEPQTIINRSYIENFMAPQQDYNGILAIVPSMTGADPAGPGLSDGGAKNTLRGFPDGSFAMQFDGIPFGDTNGPTHHSISYFPASNFGSIVVDRGPGNAGNLGAATYGGTVKFFSPSLTPDMQGVGVASVGSFQTVLGNVAEQTGNFDVFGTTSRALINVQGVSSNSALSLQGVSTKNGLMKTETDFSPNWRLTLFGSYTFLNEHLSDNNGLTPAQVAVYGKNFALQNTDPTLPTYYAYNYTHKQTDFEYIKVDGRITDAVKLENTAYTYAYWNHTFSPSSQTQTLPQIQSDTSSDNATVTLLNGTQIKNQLPAYTKENAYRVFGDVLRTTEDFNIGAVAFQAREGIWLETNQTNRFRYYFDANLCAADGIMPYDYGRQKAASVCGIKQSGAVLNGALGYSTYDENTSWQQYQPFAELDIKPTEDLTLTPGVKYVHWDHKTDSPVETKSLCGLETPCAGFNTLGQNFQESFVTTDTLPFFQANYRIDKNWSVYFEYAKGIYVPDIGVFETKQPLAPNNPPASQTTTNYQVGTVFYADDFTFDADLYYIPINNNYVSQPCSYITNETCYVNIGSATYKGIEGEGTYAISRLFGLDTAGLSVFANGALMSSKSGGLWVKNAPKWTAAGGILYHNGSWTFGLIDKTVGPQFSDNTEIAAYKIKTYSDVTATIGYTFDRFDLMFNVDNLLDSRNVVNITEGGNGTSLATSTDQYQFMAPLSMTFTVRVHF